MLPPAGRYGKSEHPASWHPSWPANNRQYFRFMDRPDGSESCLHTSRPHAGNAGRQAAVLASFWITRTIRIPSIAQWPRDDRARSAHVTTTALMRQLGRSGHATRRRSAGPTFRAQPWPERPRRQPAHRAGPTRMSAARSPSQCIAFRRSPALWLPGGPARGPRYAEPPPGEHDVDHSGRRSNQATPRRCAGTMARRVNWISLLCTPTLSRKGGKGPEQKKGARLMMGALKDKLESPGTMADSWPWDEWTV